MKSARKLIARILLGTGAVAVLAAYPLIHGHAPKEASRQVAPPHPVKATTKASMAQRTRMIEAYGKMPLFFERNQGQIDPKVKYLARGQGYAMFLTQQGATLALSETVKTKKQQKPSIPEAMPKVKTRVLRMKLAHANPHPAIHGEEKQAGISRYYSGSNAKHWVKQVSHVGRVHYDAVYPGIDLAFYGNQKKLEYDFIVKPGADPKRIGMRFAGADAMHIDKKGQLVLKVGDQQVVQHKPIIYQEIDGKRHPIEGGYVLRKNHEIAFQVASYDTKKPLVIDPVLVYSTYLGGSATDYGISIAADSAGNAYVTGWTASTNFPTLNALQTGLYNTRAAAFVTKLGPTGALVYSTYFGGSGGTIGYGITLDSTGNTWVTGATNSRDFPRTNTVQPMTAGSGAFASELDPSGRLLYSTSFSGTNVGYGIAVDGSGNVYVAGVTSSGLPVQNAFQSTYGGGGDGFIIKFSPATNQVVYSTYLGGNGWDEIHHTIAVDSAGNAFVTGLTTSTNFPIRNAFQPTYSGGLDAFVTKIAPTGSLVFSTYFGGSGDENGMATAVDSAGNVWVAGYVISSNLPTRNAFQPTYGGGNGGWTWGGDGFVAKLTPTGTLVFSTYLGGSGADRCNGVAVDSAGNGYVVGWTSSNNLPTLNATHSTYSGGTDGFVTELTPSGQLAFSTYLGGGAGYGIGLDKGGNVYVTGWTSSPSFSILNAIQPTYGGGPTPYGDAFVTKIATSQPPVASAGVAQTVNSTSATSGVVTLDASGSSSTSGGALTYTWTWPGGSATGINPTVMLPIGTTVVTLTVTDSYGNKSTSTVTITVKDTTPPVVNAPSSITVEATGATTAYDVLSQVTSSDNYCPGAPDIYPIGPYPPGVTKVIVTVTDCAGNATTVTIDLNVVDTTPPVVTAPAPVTMEATGPQSTVTLGTATATDLVNGAVTVTNNAPATFPVGTTTVTYTATDAAGNTATATQQVTVTDTTPPVIATAPAPVTVEATGPQSSVPLPPVIATDLVSGSIPCTDDAPATFPVGTTVVTYTAVDAAGNVCHRSRTVTVIDSTPPTITLPADMTVEANAVLSTVNIGTATANDLVSGAVAVTNDAPAAGFPIGTTLVTWTATDANGNASTGTQRVTVVDTTPPVLTLPADVHVEATGPQTSVAIGTATGTDIFPVTITSDAPATYPLGTTVVTWTATDANGNSSTGTQKVTVVDTTPPTVTAHLVPVKVKKHEGDFRVVFSASDLVDPNPLLTATLNGVTVTNGQIVELKAGRKVKIENDDDGLEVRAPSFTLRVSATDFSGNTGTGSASYAFPAPKDEDNGIHRGNDKADRHVDHGQHRSEGKAKIEHRRS